MADPTLAPHDPSDPYADVAVNATNAPVDPYADIASAAANVPQAAPAASPGANLYHGLTSSMNSDIAGALDIVPNAGVSVANLGGMAANAVTGHPLGEGHIQGDYVRRAMEAAGLITQPEPGMAGAAGQTMGHFVTATAGIDALAPEVAARMVPGLWKQVIGSLGATSLGRFSSDIVAAITAGAGAAVGAPVGGQVERAITDNPNGGQTGEQIGGFGGALLGGGFSPIGLALQLIPGGVKRLVGILGAKGQTTVANQLVQKIIQDGLSSPAAQAGMAKGETLAAKIPGFNPSVAEASGSQGLVNEQKYVQSSAAGKDLEALKAREAGNQKAIADYQGAATPAGGEISSVVDAATNRVTNLLAPIGAAETAQVPTVAAGAEQRAGDILRRRYEQLKAQVKGAFDQRFGAIRASAGDADISPAFQRYAQDVQNTVDPASVFTRPEDIAPVLRDRVFPFNQAAAQPSNAMAAMTGVTKSASQEPVTLKDLMVLRQKLSDGIIDAVGGTTPNRAWVRQMVIAKGKLDTMLQSLPLGQEYQKTIRDYFDQYVSRFEQGTAFKVAQRDGRGFVQTTPEKVAAQFIDGSYTSAMQYQKTFGNDPRALTALRSAVTDDFRTAVAPNGVIDAGKAQRWMNSHEGLLRAFPDMEISANTLLQRQLDLNSTRESIENTALARAVSSVAKEAKGPEQVVTAALTNPHLARELLATVKGTDAEPALQRYLFQNAPEGATLADYLDNPLVKGALTPQHVADLRTIFDAKAMAARVGPATGTTGEIAPLGAVQAKLGVKIPQVASRMFAVASGRTSERYVLTEGAARLFNKLGMARGRELLEKALYDRDLARSIASSIFTRGRVGYDPAVRLRPWLAYYGLTGYSTNQSNADQVPHG